jgi:hypothetical protein
MSDPSLLKFLSPYQPSCGYSEYRSKVSESSRDSLFANGPLKSTAPSGSAISPSKARQNSITLPGPLAATTSSFAEIRNYKQRNVVPKYAPSERFGSTITESMEAGWRAKEMKQSEAAKQFNMALTGKGRPRE